MSGSEKTKLNLQKKCTLSDNWNIYDPLGDWFESCLEENIWKYENELKWLKMTGNENMNLKLHTKCTLSDNWNTYDPIGEDFFFAIGPFSMHIAFLLNASLIDVNIVFYGFRIERRID